jgi:hypothetical protein
LGQHVNEDALPEERTSGMKHSGLEGLEVHELIGSVAAPQAHHPAERRSAHVRGGGVPDARVLGWAYLKQVDVLNVRWSQGRELLVSTKRMVSSFRNKGPAISTGHWQMRTKRSDLMMDVTRTDFENFVDFKPAELHIPMLQTMLD